MQCASLFRYKAPMSQANGVSSSAPLSLAHMPRPRPASGRVRLAPPSAGGRPLETRTVGSSTNIRWHKASVAREDKERLLGQRGCVLWFTGLSASGKSTVATETERQLHERGHLTLLLDGDNVRHGLNCNLGFRCDGVGGWRGRMGWVGRCASRGVGGGCQSVAAVLQGGMVSYALVMSAPCAIRTTRRGTTNAQRRVCRSKAVCHCATALLSRRTGRRLGRSAGRPSLLGRGLGLGLDVESGVLDLRQPIPCFD